MYELKYVLMLMILSFVGGMYFSGLVGYFAERNRMGMKHDGFMLLIIFAFIMGGLYTYIQ